MKLTRARLLGAVAVLVGGAGLGVLLLADRSDRGAMPDPDAVASTISAGELEAVGELRVFFGHMSVGGNILAGIEKVYDSQGVASPAFVQFTVGGALPQPPATGAIVHTEIGPNGDPVSKLRNFDSVLRSGLADRIDVALLKFCYVDVSHATDVDALFAEYRSTLDTLERDFPDVTFLHSTAPLMADPGGVKGFAKNLLGRNDNPAREKYNDLMRQAYGTDRLFDLAAIESTAPDGSRTPAMYGGYTTDGGHLNEGGSALAAVGLLRLLAAAGQS